MNNPATCSPSFLTKENVFGQPRGSISRWFLGGVLFGWPNMPRGSCRAALLNNLTHLLSEYSLRKKNIEVEKRPSRQTTARFPDLLALHWIRGSPATHSPLFWCFFKIMDVASIYHFAYHPLTLLISSNYWSLFRRFIKLDNQVNIKLVRSDQGSLFNLLLLLFHDFIINEGFVISSGTTSYISQAFLRFVEEPICFISRLTES